MRFLKPLLKGLLWFAVPLGIALAVLRAFFVSVVVVGHSGMAPTLLKDEAILVWNGVEDPKMGDVLLCQHPQDASQLVIGRVVAKGGMTILTERGLLEVSETRPERDVQGRVTFQAPEGGPHRGPQVVQRIEETMGNSTRMIFVPERYDLSIREQSVPSGEVFLLSDFRSRSDTDSRTFGTVPVDRCVGTFFMRWSPQEAEGIEHGMFDLIR